MTASSGEPAHAPGAGTSEGPLAHAARAVAERSYLDALDRIHQQGWERASGGRPEPMSKRWLVALSHAIEKAVMSGPIEKPTVIIAMFQRLEFFDRERDVYARMAAAGLEVVIGFIEDEAHETPPGVHPVLLRSDEALADEWTVVAVGPRAGAFLVATDQHRFDPDERDHQAGRQFAGRWGFSRTQAGGELARLRFALGERLPPTLRRTIDGLLAQVMPTGEKSADSAGTPGEMWATTSLYHLIDRMQSVRAGNRDLREQLADAQRAAAARAGAAQDPASGLPTADFLDRWSVDPGATTLPIGLALFDIPALGQPELQDDRRAAYLVAHRVAAAMTLPLGPVDAVVRLSTREFLLVVPGASSRHLAALCDQISEGLELPVGGYPDVALRAVDASMITRERPFPLAELREAVGRLDPHAGLPDHHGPFDAGSTRAGENIILATTALHSQVDRGPGHEPSADPARNGRTDRPHGEHAREPTDDPRDRDADDEDNSVPLPRRDAQSRLHALADADGSADVFSDPTMTLEGPR